MILGNRIPGMARGRFVSRPQEDPAINRVAWTLNTGSSPSTLVSKEDLDLASQVQSEARVIQRIGAVYSRRPLSCEAEEYLDRLAVSVVPHPSVTIGDLKRALFDAVAARTVLLDSVRDYGEWVELSEAVCPTGNVPVPRRFLTGTARQTESLKIDRKDLLIANAVVSFLRDT